MIFRIIFPFMRITRMRPSTFKLMKICELDRQWWARRKIWMTHRMTLVTCNYLLITCKVSQYGRSNVGYSQSMPVKSCRLSNHQPAYKIWAVHAWEGLRHRCWSTKKNIKRTLPVILNIIHTPLRLEPSTKWFARRRLYGRFLILG